MNIIKPNYFIELGGRVGYIFKGKEYYGILPGDEKIVAKFLRDIVGYSNEGIHGIIENFEPKNKSLLEKFH